MGTEALRAAVKLDFRFDLLREQRLKPLCLAVLKEFPPVPARIYCYFAWGEDTSLQRKYGKYFRGFGTPFAGSDLPNYLINLAIDSSGNIAFDNLVYIRAGTCSDTTGFVLTFAHELQHTFQYCCARKIWAANTLLYHHLRRTLDPDTTLQAIDIPHEREANIISKRVAQSICGLEAVKKFAEEQVIRFTPLAQGFGDDEAIHEKRRWEVFRDLDASLRFDLLEATKPLVNRYQQPIIEHRLDRDYELDFRKEEWWK